MAKDVIRIARATNPKMSRRKYVTLGAGAVVVVAAAAAGGYYLSMPKGPEETTTATTEATTSWIKPESIRYDGWGGTAQDIISRIGFKSFEEEYGIKVEEGSFGQTSEIMAKVKAAGGGEWDMIEVDNDTIYYGTVDGLWQPLDLKNIPNHEKLPEIFRTNGWGAFDPGYKDGIYHGIPGPMYGTTPIVINTEKISPEPDSIAALWDKKWKGRMCLENWWVTRIRYAAAYLGEDYNNIADIDAIWKALREQQKLVFKYWDSGSEMETMLTNEEAWIGDLWGGRVLKLAQRGVPVKPIFPKEGTEVWTDALVVPINAPHKYEAELLINWLLDPKINEAMALEYLYPPIVDVKYVSAEVKEKLKELPDYVGEDYDKLGFANTSYYNAHRDEWSEMFETIKAGG